MVLSRPVSEDPSRRGIARRVGSLVAAAADVRTALANLGSATETSGADMAAKDRMNRGRFAMG